MKKFKFSKLHTKMLNLKKNIQKQISYKVSEN